MNRVALTATGLTKGFKSGRGRVQVLRGVDFQARHGELTLVMGPSGSGKSTLIAAMSGLLKPDAGAVTALGQDLWSLRPGKIDGSARPLRFISRLNVPGAPPRESS